MKNSLIVGWSYEHNSGSGPLRITLSAWNLFNEEYYWSGGSETVDPGSPRQVLITTSVLFK